MDQRERDSEGDLLGAVVLGGVGRPADLGDERQGVLVTAASDSFAFTATPEFVGQLSIVVHLGVLVLRVELDDSRPDRPVAADLDGVGPLLAEELPEDVLRKVGLSGACPAGHQRVSEDQRVAGVVGVLQTVVDCRRLGRRLHLLAADREMAQEDPVFRDLEAGLDRGALLGVTDDRLRLGDAVGHPTLEFAVLFV